MKRPEKAALISIIVAIAGAVLAVASWPDRLRFPFDDTFISFRYAEHLASGSGLVWNVGGPACEGYTNFLFIVVLAVGRCVTTDLLFVSQLVGCLATVGTAVLVYLMTQRLANSGVALLAPALYLLAPLTWINAMSGMETSFFVFLTVLALWSAIERRFAASFAAATLATLTRPEGALLVILIAIAAITIDRMALRAFLLLFVLPLIVYAGWKLFYFGSLLPNSFYVKVVHTDLENAHPGLQYVRLFAVSDIVLLVVTLFLRQWRTRPVVMAAVVWALGLMGFYIFVRPLEGVYDRFLMPSFAVLCFTATVAVQDRVAKRFVIASAALFVLQMTVTLLSPRTRQSLRAHEEKWDESMDPIVRTLEQLPNKSALTLGYGDAGYVVYKSGVRHLDLFGLNWTELAHARTLEARAAILRSADPTLLLLPVRSLTDSCSTLVEDAYGVARDSNYHAAAAIDAFPYPLVFFVSRTNAQGSATESALQRTALSHTFGLTTPPSCFR